MMDFDLEKVAMYMVLFILGCLSLAVGTTTLALVFVLINKFFQVCS